MKLSFVYQSLLLLCLGAGSLSAQLIAQEQYKISNFEGQGYKASANMQAISGPGVAGQLNSPAEAGTLRYYDDFKRQATVSGSRFGTVNPYIPNRVISESLTYGNLAVKGGKLNVSSGGLPLFAPYKVAADGPFAAYSNGNVIGEKNGVLWCAFLFRLVFLDANNQAYIQFLDTHNLTDSFEGGVAVKNPQARWRFGQDWGSINFAVSGGGWSEIINENVYLVVTKTEFKDGNDTVTTYINPDITKPESELLAASVWNGDARFTAIELKSQVSSADPLSPKGLYIDEIRFGASFGDVTPQAASFTLTFGEYQNGTVEQTPAPVEGVYLEGTSVKLKATASTGYRFVSWEGVAGADAAKNPVTITMLDNRTITPVFEAIPDYQLTLAVNDVAAGAVMAFPDLELVPEGTEVEIEAFPNEGYEFVGFMIGDASYTDNPLLRVISENTSVIAQFRPVSIYPGARGDKLTTTLGWINDLDYPAVYSWEAGIWLYVSPSAATMDSAYIYNYATNQWFWSGQAYGRWTYNFSSQRWELFAGK